MPSILGANTLSSGYDVANSLRFNDGSSDYLNKTLGTATNRKKFTISVWFKKCNNSNAQYLASAGTNVSSVIDDLSIHSSQVLNFSGYESSTTYKLRTNALLRDSSAWYHVVVAYDSTQGTDTNRLKMYLNGTQVTSFSSATYPSQNLEVQFNKNVEHMVGRNLGGSSYMDGYIAEFCFIDGQQLDPTSFGEFDSDSGIWKPIDVSGLTFGNNGFYLDFEDSSALGNDVAGSNNFTVNNLTAVDQSTDTCTNNFCTLNPISEHNDSTFSDGNLTYTGNASAVHNAIGSIGVTQGKWYFEAKRVTGNSAYPFAGVFNADGSMGSYLGATSDGWSILMDANDNGEWRNNGTLSGTSAGTFSNGNIAMIAIDMDNGKIWFGKDGTWAASGNPSAGSGEQYSNLTGTIVPAVAVYTGASVSLNFGSPPYSISSGNSDANSHGNFEYAVPTGFYSLNSKNLAEHG